MAYDFEKHQSVHEYTTKANYILELLKYVYFDNDTMHQYDWPGYTRIMGLQNDDAAYQKYRKQVDIANDRVKTWATKLTDMLQDFIDHHRQNKTGLNVVGIKKSFDEFSVRGEPYYRAGKDDPIRIITIMFKSDEARYEFAEYISKQGYYDTIQCFTEAPRRGKKDLIATG